MLKRLADQGKKLALVAEGRNTAPELAASVHTGSVGKVPLAVDGRIVGILGDRMELPPTAHGLGKRMQE